MRPNPASPCGPREALLTGWYTAKGRPAAPIRARPAFAQRISDGDDQGVELTVDRSEGGGEADGLARRYATALFDLAVERRQLPQVEEDGRRLRTAVAASPDLRNLLGNPLFGRADTARALKAVAGHLEVSDLTANFVGVLAANRRLPALLPILRVFATLAAAHRGEVTAEVTVARPLSPDQLATLRQVLRERVGREVSVETHTDASILGGLVVRLGSELIDSSIRTKLNTLAQAMKG